MMLIVDMIKKYRSVERSSFKSLYLLSNIWVYENDIKFNLEISDLIELMSPLLHFNDLYTKLVVYKLLFKIDFKESIKIGSIAQMLQSHIIDTWRLLLLQINSNMLRLINDYLWSKRRSTGYYIQQLQCTFANKNRTIHSQRAIIKMLGKLLKKEQRRLLNITENIENTEYDYEIV